MNKAIKPKIIILSLVFVGILVFIDIITKVLAVQALKDKDPISLIDGVLEFFYLENTGAAWSILSGNTWVFLVVTPIFMVFILFFYIRIPKTKTYFPLNILALILLSGALGNLIDRVSLGYVRDFIYIKLINFPVFNVADIYVTLSLIILIILIFFKYNDSDLALIFKGGKKDDKTPS